MAVYNYGFPVTYQPMQQYPNNVYTQPQQQMSYVQTTSQPQQGIIWVQGEAGAKAYPVAAGSNVLLMDSESECFYIKSTDPSGMPLPLRIFKYEEIIQAQEIPPQQSHNTSALSDSKILEQFAKKEDLQLLEQKIDALSNSKQKIERRDKDGK